MTHNYDLIIILRNPPKSKLNWTIFNKPTSVRIITGLGLKFTTIFPDLFILIFQKTIIFYSFNRCPQMRHVFMNIEVINVFNRIRIEN